LKDKWGRILHVCDTIAFAYDPDLFVLHKHGAPDLVQAWLDHANQKLSKVPEKDRFQLAMLVVDKRVPVEEINRVLDTSGYLRIFIEKFSKPVLTEK
jgi:hypothetical protein